MHSQEKSASPDVLVSNVGTLYTFCPLTLRAKEWIDQHVDFEPWQWFGHVLVVEHRFAWGLAQGMNDSGLALQRGALHASGITQSCCPESRGRIRRGQSALAQNLVESEYEQVSENKLIVEATSILRRRAANRVHGHDERPKLSPSFVGSDGGQRGRS